MIADHRHRRIQMLEGMIPAVPHHHPTAVQIAGAGDAEVDDLIAAVQEKCRRHPVARVGNAEGAGCLDQIRGDLIGLAVRRGHGLALMRQEQVPGGERRIDQEQMRKGETTRQPLAVKAAHGTADDGGTHRPEIGEEITQPLHRRGRSMGRIVRRQYGMGRKTLAQQPRLDRLAGAVESVEIDKHADGDSVETMFLDQPFAILRRVIDREIALPREPIHPIEKGPAGKGHAIDVEGAELAVLVHGDTAVIEQIAVSRLHSSLSATERSIMGAFSSG